MNILFKSRYVLLLALLFPLQSCAGTYTAEPIEAWVVDKETDQPLEGVIVTANWQLEIGTPGGNVPAGQMMVMETVTDASGRLSFPGWGPEPIPDRRWESKENPLMIYLFSSGPHLVNKDPQLLFFKSGYKTLELVNYFSTNYNKGPLRHSEWNGKTIKMEKFKGAQTKYMEMFGDFNYTLHRIALSKPTYCYWKNIQKTIRAMNQERNRLVALGANPNTLSSIDNDLLRDDKFYTEKGGCGSPKQFFGEFKQ